MDKENIIILSTTTIDGLLLNLNNIALIKKEESSQGEWLHVFFNNGESTTIYNADRELWNKLIGQIKEEENDR